MATRAKQIDFLLSANLKTSGNINSSGYAYFYADSGRTIQKDVYDSATKDNVLSQPVTIGVRGTADVFADGTYWISVFDKNDVQVDTIDNVSYQVDVNFGGIWTDLASEYGRTASDLQDAIDDIGSDEATIYLRSGEFTIASDITVPSNIFLLFGYGAYFTVSNTITLTIQGDIEAPYYNIFQGSGTVTLTNKDDGKDLWTNASANIGDVSFEDVDCSTLDVTGAVGIDGDLDVATNKFTVASATGNTAIAGTLDVTGATGIDGNFDINTNKFTVASATGNTLIAGTLGVTGTTTVSTLTDSTATLTGGALTGLTQVNNVTATELSQLETIGTTTISATQWGYVGSLDQSLTTSDSVSFSSITDGTATLTGGALTGLTSLTVDNINLNLNTISTTTGNLNLTPVAGSNITFDGTITIDAGVVAGITSLNSISSTELSQLENINSTTISTTQWGYVGAMDQSVTSTDSPTFVTLNCTTADFGTNTIYDGNMTGNWDFQTGSLSNITSITATNLTGTLQTVSQPNITSVGTLTSLTVSGDLTVDTDTLFVDSVNNRVGIGTGTFTNAAKLLVKSGGVGTLAFAVERGANTNRLFYVDEDSSGDADAYLRDSSNSNKIRLNTNGDSYLNGGNVGIGTSSPLGQFELKSTFPNILLHDSDATSTQRIIRISNSSGKVIFGGRNDTNSGDGAAGTIMTIDLSNGNLGIGTSDPQNLFHIHNDSVNGTAFVYATEGDGGDPDTGMIFGYEGNGNRFVIKGINEGSISSEWFIVERDSGKVGIGTSGPDAKLDVLSTTEQLRLTYADGSVYTSFTTDSSGNLTINNSGTKTIFSDAVDIGGNGTALKFKVIDIGDWNMDSDLSVNVAHGLSTDYDNIRMIWVQIRNDADTSTYPLYFVGTGANTVGGGVNSINSTNIAITRDTGGQFDSTDFDSTSYNRGWVTVWYE